MCVFSSEQSESFSLHGFQTQAGSWSELSEDYDAWCLWMPRQKKRKKKALGGPVCKKTS